MSIVVPLASGKGGVGKSVLAANLSFQLASKGKSVILVDLDWGGSNAHTILGVLNNNEGIGRFMLDKEKTLSSYVVPLEIPRLSLIPGDGVVAGGANIPLVRKHKLLKELAALEADYVVLDLGAGSHSNTVDAFLSSSLAFMVSTPEPTAVLNAYSFLKTALFRLLSQSVPPKSEARSLVVEFFTGKRDRSDRQGLEEVINRVQQANPLHGEKLTEARSRLRPRVALNMGMNSSELNLGAKLRQLCERQLGLAIEYVALMPWDPLVRQSVIDRKLISQHRPDAPFVRAVGILADRIIETGFPNDPPWGTYYDLESLAEEL